MGNCIQLCCCVCCKYTYYADSLGDNILDKITDHLNKLITPNSINLNEWYVSFSRDVYKQFTISLKTKLFIILKKLNFKVFVSNQILVNSLSENIAYYIVNNLLDEEYKNTMKKNDYVLLDIKTDSIFYNRINILIDEEKINKFKDYLTTIKIDDKLETISLKTTDKAYKDIFDKKLEVKLLETINKIKDKKLESIINKIINTFNNNEIRNKKIMDNQEFTSI